MTNHRKCVDCIDCYRPEIDWDVPQFPTLKCHQFVDVENGVCVDMATHRARTYCDGDYWYPKNPETLWRALRHPRTWPNLVFWWRCG